MRPLNPDQKRNLKDQIKEWIEQGVIEPANSPWASPLVPVKKKDGRTRWVTDLLHLNSGTLKDAYPLTNIQENLQKLKVPQHSRQSMPVAMWHLYKSRQEVEIVKHLSSRLEPFVTYECHLAYLIQAVCIHRC